MKAELAALITEALEKLVTEGVLEAVPDASPQIDRPKDTSHGDLSCNIAMVLAKRAGLPPRDLATRIIDALPDNTLVKTSNIAGPGFLNFFIYAGHHTGSQSDIEDRVGFGCCDEGAGRRVQVEFVSATPPARFMSGTAGAAIGDHSAACWRHRLAGPQGVLLQRRRAADQQSGTVVQARAGQDPR